jgi:pullulanase
MNEYKWEKYPQHPYTKVHTVTGDVRVLRGVSGKGLAARDIYIYLPPSYIKNATKNTHYPVLYMQDGQNVFDNAIAFAGEWGADETAERFATASRKRECIIVAIPNAGVDRMSEYSPWSRTTPRFSLHGKGDTYLDFVEHTIKPIVDVSFRTHTHANATGIAGSSLGGLISIYAALTRPHVFGYCAALSPAIWFAFGQLDQLAHAKAQQQIAPMPRFYLDMGWFEGRRPSLKPNIPGMVADARRLYEVLKQCGYPAFYYEDKAGRHNEACWQRRFPKALRLFLDHL